MKQDCIDLYLVSINFYPVYAGPAIRFQRYAAGLHRRGNHIRVFSGTPETARVNLANESSLSPHSGKEAIGELLPLVTVDELPIQQVKLPGVGRIKRSTVYNRALLNYCRKQSTRPDLIHFLSLPLWSAPWVWRLHRLNIPLVFTHTLLGELSSQPVKRHLQRILWRWPIQLMDCVIVSSSVMEKMLRELGVSVPIEVIPNGVNLSRFRPVTSPSERQHLREKLALPTNAKLILSVGPIIPRKATDILIEAWGKLCHRFPESRLVLVGPRTHEEYPSLQEFGQRIKKLVVATGASDRIIFAGHVNNVEDYLRAADLFVFPSRREGMPNVVPEAMACGLPTVLTPFLGLPDEFGRPGEHYVLTERMPEALAKAMIDLLDNAAHSHQLSVRARQWVIANLDVEQSLDQYSILYRNLVRSAKKGKLKEC